MAIGGFKINPGKRTKKNKQPDKKPAPDVRKKNEPQKKER